jgi:hypothetical protein
MNNLKRALLLFLLFTSFSCSSFAKPIKMVYLIPEGYTGGVYILYNDLKGINAETLEDGTIIHRIPKDGILIVKPPAKLGPFKLSYFYVDANDNRQEIEYLNPPSYVKDSSEMNSRNVDEVTEDERDNRLFAMSHRRIGFSISNQKTLLYVFSLGYPKDSISLYTDIDRRGDEMVKKAYEKIDIIKERVNE